jgi:uncharacterized protein (DUF58 family)
MKINNVLAQWLETRWATPAYSGWVLIGIALCFFGAATNTMAGWLYALSGTIFALLVLGAVLPMRSLRQIEIRRSPIAPVSAGDELTIELAIENPSNSAKTLLQIQDLVPFVLAQPVQTNIEAIAPKSIHHWTYYLHTKQRGVYRWQEIQIRTGTPLGLFWCRRGRETPAKAIVYPQVLPLANCPLIDSFGRDESRKLQSDRRYQAASEGVTRALRPYRYGDPTRLIHWRVSARYDRFVVRELEVITGGQDIIIALDSASRWEADSFEQAVIAAASLYFYASRSQLEVKLWTAKTGLIHGNRVVLETLAAVASEEVAISSPPALPLVWLTQNADTIAKLGDRSRWLFFPSSSDSNQLEFKSNLAGLAIAPEQSLQLQLGRSLRINSLAG